MVKVITKRVMVTTNLCCWCAVWFSVRQLLYVIFSRINELSGKSRIWNIRTDSVIVIFKVILQGQFSHYSLDGARL